MRRRPPTSRRHEGAEEAVAEAEAAADAEQAEALAGERHGDAEVPAPAETGTARPLRRGRARRPLRELPPRRSQRRAGAGRTERSARWRTRRPARTACSTTSARAAPPGRGPGGSRAGLRVRHRQPRPRRLPAHPGRGARRPARGADRAGRARRSPSFSGSIPPGSGPATLSECFLLQLDRFDRRDGTRDAGAHPAGGRRGASTTFSTSAGIGIAQTLRRHRESIRAGARGAAPPRPASRGRGSARTTTRRSSPMSWWSRMATSGASSLNDDGLPRLRLSPRYLRLLQSRTLDGETNGYLRERMRSALWFLRSVEQRQSTICARRRGHRAPPGGLSREGHRAPAAARAPRHRRRHRHARVDGEPGRRQQVHGHPARSLPAQVLLPLRDLARRPGRHLVGGRQGTDQGADRTRRTQRRPLSDARVARQLNRLGIRIARRTVAKYREELGVPSSEQRRRVLR